ncbi:MAG: hypothetical protein LBS32_07285 [Clostridiales Family XIII bacterium]|jgi:hypothetical protein|nr:hypothetical protein [Clostridiales Family XIII bacterium]
MGRLIPRLALSLAALLAIGLFAPFSFALPDPAVTLVSPPENEAIVTNNFLISVKVTQPGKAISVSAEELRQKSGDKWVSVKPEELEEFDKKKDEEKSALAVMEAESFESKGSVSFYTRKIENITPGVYLIRVETLDAAGKAVYSKESRILVKEKTEEETKVFDSQKSGTSQFLQSLLSKIFKS